MYGNRCLQVRPCQDGRSWAGSYTLLFSLLSQTCSPAQVYVYVANSQALTDGTLPGPWRTCRMPHATEYFALSINAQQTLIFPHILSC